MWIRLTNPEIEQWLRYRDRQSRKMALFALISIPLFAVIGGYFLSSCEVMILPRSGAMVPMSRSGPYTMTSSLVVGLLIAAIVACVVFFKDRKTVRAQTICRRCEQSGENNAGADCPCSGVFVPRYSVEWFDIHKYENAPAEFHAHDPDAGELALRIAESIEYAYPGLKLEHIGSTAVVGLGGKGIIDLMLLYPPGTLEEAKEILDRAGFQRQSTRDPYPEDRPMRTGAVKFHNKLFRVHVHVIAADAEEANRLRGFRDRLRADEDLRAGYEACKQKILAAGITNSTDYSETKSEFIQSNLR